MTYLLLFFEFLKVGLFTVGGGLASIPFLYDMAAKYPWFTNSDIVDMIAISESTPGAIGINMATYAGFSAGGWLGSVTATVAVIIPEIVIVLIVAKVLERLTENRFVQGAFYGIRPVVTALISSALFEVVKVSLLRWDIFTQALDYTQLVDYKAVALFAILLILIRKFHKHPVVYIAGAAVIGVIIPF